MQIGELQNEKNEKIGTVHSALFNDGSRVTISFY